MRIWLFEIESPKEPIIITGPGLKMAILPK